MKQQLSLDIERQQEPSGFIDFNCADCGCLVRCYKPRVGPLGYDPIPSGRCLCCWFQRDRADQRG